jgi:hypothetical protein
LLLRRRTLLLQPALNGSSRPPSFACAACRCAGLSRPSSKKVSCLNSTMLDAAPLHRSTLHRQPQPCDLRSNLPACRSKVTAIVLTCRVLHRLPTWPSLVASMNEWRNCAFPTFDRRTTSILIPAIHRLLEARTPSFPHSRRLRTIHGRVCSVASQLIQAKSRAQRLGHNIHK